MLTGTNHTHARQYNLRIVHETIRLYGPLSRADIARRTELTAQTVSNLVRQLMSEDLVVEVEKRQQGRGAPSIDLALNLEAGFSIGLDLDTDHLTGVLVDLSGTVRQRVYYDLDCPSPEEALALMEQSVHALMKAQGIARSKLWGIGIGIPGPMHPAPEGQGTYIVNPWALPGWQNVPIADLLSQRFDLPVSLENNATAAAVGERWYGAGQHIATFYYVYFGMGLGGGLVIGGQPYEGNTGNAGEIGYVPLLPRTAPTLRAGAHSGELFNLPKLLARMRAGGAAIETAGDLARLVEEQHPALLAWMDEAVEELLLLMLTVEYLLDPQAIFFGGRLPHTLLQALLDRVHERLPAVRISGSLVSPQYMLATVGEDAAALGVATLPIYEYVAPAPSVLNKRSAAEVAAQADLHRPASVFLAH